MRQDMAEQPRYASDMIRPRASQPAPVKPPPTGFLRAHWKMVLVAVVLAAGVGWLIYSYVNTRAQLAKLSSGGSEVQQIVENISKNLQLPDEVPTLATVSDVSKLKGQEFFKNAQNGDKVLIFSKDGRALLYRSSTKKIIEYSKVDLSTTKQ
jgi:hypothetical protein